VSPTTLLYGTGGLAWTEVHQTVISDQTTTTAGTPASTTETITNGSAPSWRFGAGRCGADRDELERLLSRYPWRRRLRQRPVRQGGHTGGLAWTQVLQGVVSESSGAGFD